LRKENWLLPSKKKERKIIKTKFIDLDYAGNDKLLNQLLLSSGMLVNIGKKVFMQLERY